MSIAERNNMGYHSYITVDRIIRFEVRPMRIAIVPLIFAFGIVAAQAAPVPTPGATPEIRSRFDDLWDRSTRSESGVVRLQCYLETLSSKQRAAILADKMLPVQLSQKQAKAWLRDLASDDERTWKEAEAKFRKLDIRLAMTFADAWDHTENDLTRWRLASLVDAIPETKYGPLSNYTLTIQLADRGCCTLNWAPRQDLPAAAFPLGKCGSSHNLVNSFETGDFTRNEWIYSRKSLALASDYLVRDDPANAKLLLERVAGGHPGVGPTHDAKRAIAQLKWANFRILGYPVVPKTVETDWNKLWGPARDDLPKLGVTQRVLADPKTAIAFLKTKLKPQIMEKAEAVKLLEAYLGDDSEKAQKALDEFQIRDFRLAVPFTEAWEMATDVRGRFRLVAYDKFWAVKTLEGIDSPCPRKDFRLSPPNADREYWTTDDFLLPEFDPMPNEGFGGYPTYNTLEGRYWDYSREEIGLVWLEAIDSPEAWTLIRAISKGNPKVELTTFAQQLIATRKR